MSLQAGYPGKLEALVRQLEIEEDLKQAKSHEDLRLVCMKASTLRKIVKDYAEQKTIKNQDQLLDKLREGVFDLDTELSPMKKKFDQYLDEDFQDLWEKIQANVERLSKRVESMTERKPYVPSRQNSLESILS